MTPDKLPPQDLEAERSVLGSIMVASEAIDDATMHVSPEHFYSEANGKMFAAMRDMVTSGRSPDVVTLGHELEARGQLEQVGGPAYLVKCLETVPHAAHCEYYARIVREMADRRACIQHAGEIIRAAYDLSSDTEEAVASIEQSITGLVESRARDNRTTDLGTILIQAITRIEQGEIRGMMTGLDALDEITTGMHAAQLIVVGARPRVGKSAFALNVARHIAKSTPTMFFSLEMSKLELAERLLAIESANSLYDMRTGRLNEHEQWELTEAANRLNGLPLYIDDDANRSLLGIAAMARTMKRRKGIGFIIIDYLQLMTPRDGKSVREQQIAEMTRGLKCLAKSLDIPVMVLAQLNREADRRSDPTPKLSDLRESGAIENDADQVWLLHRPVLYMDATESGYDLRAHDAEIHVAKNRSGPAGRADLIFQETLLRFKGVEVADPFMYQK